MSEFRKVMSKFYAKRVRAVYEQVVEGKAYQHVNVTPRQMELRDIEGHKDSYRVTCFAYMAYVEYLKSCMIPKGTEFRPPIEMVGAPTGAIEFKLQLELGNLEKKFHITPGMPNLGYGAIW